MICFVDGVFDHRGYTEKALAKMIKAKGKADRAAARAALAAAHGGSSSHPPVVPASAAPTPVSMPEETSTDASMAVAGQSESQDGQGSQPIDMIIGDALPLASGSGERERERDKTAVRIETLKGRPDLVHRFLHYLVPILVDVYAASVALQVRSRALTGILKAVSWMDGDDLLGVLKVRSASLIHARPYSCI